VFGPDVNLHIYRAERADEIPSALWRTCDIVICFDIKIDATTITSFERCRQIVRAGVGVDQIDLAAAARHGIPVCNTPDYGTMDVADHAIAMMLALTRGIVAFSGSLRADPVKGWDFLRAPTVRRLCGLTFGVLGLGRIGTAAALRAKAFGMDVLFFDPYRPSGTELALGVRRAESLASLLSQTDVLSIHAPLSPETDNLINAEKLSLMRPDAILVNTARGPIVDTSALLAALRQGRIAAAALDVIPVEPPSGGDPLIEAWLDGDPVVADRLILSPHAAFYSPSSLIDLRTKSAQVALDYLTKGLLRNCVNGIQI
jgi:lactate dehydrogenase-like 2-hydroxyacid dehydrogenase